MVVEVVSDDLTITLSSREGEEMKIKAKHAFMSKHIKAMIEDTGPEDTVPVPSVSMTVLKKVMEYCSYHHAKPPKEIKKPLENSNLEEVVEDWDYEFIQVEQELLIDLISAANYLDIPQLLELACAKVASMIYGKSIEEIRDLLGIVNDFSPEEEARIREENKWCEEA